MPDVADLLSSLTSEIEHLTKERDMYKAQVEESRGLFQLVETLVAGWEMYQSHTPIPNTVQRYSEQSVRRWGEMLQEVGNLSEVARHFDMSYSTARIRLRKAGYLCRSCGAIILGEPNGICERCDESNKE